MPDRTTFNLRFIAVEVEPLFNWKQNVVKVGALTLPTTKCYVTCGHYTIALSSRKQAYIILTPLNPTLFIVKLGFTGVYIIFLISAQKHRLWVLVRTASSRQF